MIFNRYNLRQIQFCKTQVPQTKNIRPPPPMTCPYPLPNQTKFCKTFSIPLPSTNTFFQWLVFFFFSNRFLQKLHHLHYHFFFNFIFLTSHAKKSLIISFSSLQYLSFGIGNIVFSSNINRLVTIDYFERYKIFLSFFISIYLSYGL